MTRLTQGGRKHSIASLLTPACLHLPLLCIWPLISFEITCEIRTQCVFCPLINFTSHQLLISNPFPTLSFTTNKLDEELALHQILTAASLTLFCFVFWSHSQLLLVYFAPDGCNNRFPKGLIRCAGLSMHFPCIQSKYGRVLVSWSEKSCFYF